MSEGNYPRLQGAIVCLTRFFTWHPHVSTVIERSNDEKDDFYE